MSVAEPPAPPKVAVVIATSNRFAMLSERSIPSVLAQTRFPDLVIVVDDSIASVRPVNAKFVAALSLPGCEFLYLENARTAGASGAWNTAFDFLVAKSEDVVSVFVAILDDDDSWSPDYLATCYSAAVAQQLDMVACGLRRIESNADAPQIGEAPDVLRAQDFLASNPGIRARTCLCACPSCSPLAGSMRTCAAPPTETSASASRNWAPSGTGKFLMRWSITTPMRNDNG